MGSADLLISELEHIVAKLAERQDSYDNNIFPNIDIFLIGVDTERPIRFDPIFSEQHGMELQPVIPILELKDFLNDNLDPIGIIPKRDRRDRDLYELTGKVFTGWLRFLSDPDYVVIFPRKEAIPRGMKHPAELHRELVEKGYSLFAQLDNTKTDPKVRQSAFEKMVANTVEGIQKRPDETQNAHALRKASLNQQLALFQQWFVESKGLTLGSRLDKEKDTAIMELLFSALSGTQLEKDIARTKNEASLFAAVETPENAILKSRIHFTFDERTAQGLRDVYALTEKVAKEEVEADEKLSAEDKKSRTKLAELLQQVMTKSSEAKVVDGFMDIVPSGKAHAFLMGVRCDGKTEILEALNEVAAYRKEMKIERDVAEAAGVKLQKLSLGDKAPQALKEMYGDGFDTVYIAADENAFWLAFGENAQAELSKRIEAVHSAKDLKSDAVVMSMTAKVGPLVKSLNGLLSDESSFVGSFYKELQGRRSAARDEKKKEEGLEEDEERPARQAATNFMSFDWIEKVIGSMEGEDDTMVFEMKVTDEGTITGNGEAHRGILKAVGVMIANFADETLQ